MTILIPSCPRALERSVGFLLALSVTTALGSAQQQPDPAHARPTTVHDVPGELAPILGQTNADRIEHSAGPRTDPLIPIHTSEADQGIAYGIWAAGPGYKVSFHDGATFVPLLGEHYPHNQPWTWRTSSVTAGAQELATETPRLSYDGLHAEYDLGSVVEAYDVREDGVEQTFVLRQRPAAGDLIIRGIVQSMLHTNDQAPTHVALRFCDEQGLHLVSYGAATAIDATGRTRAMSTAFENGTITLRLDGAWLATAALPVIVDPLIGPGDQLSGDVRDEVDVVRDSEGFTESVWIGYSAWASAADRDVYLRRYSDTGQLGPGVFADLSANWSSQGARCAYVAGADRTVVVFDRLFANTGLRLLRFHAHQLNDVGFSSAVASITTSDNAWRCDVGGTEGNSSGNNAMVCWQQEPNNGPFAATPTSDIYGCMLNLVTGLAGTPFVIANAASTDQERPSVNQTALGSINDGWRVAYQTVSTGVIGGTDDWDIAVKEVRSNGNVSAPHFIDNGSSDHKFAPIIEGFASHYLVAFAATPTTSAFPTGVNGEQIRVARVEWDTGSGVGSEPWGTVTLQSNNDARLELGGLGYDRDTLSHWALMFRSNVTELLYLRTVGHRGQLLQAETVINPAGSDSSVRGGVSYDATGSQFIVAYGINGASGNYVTMDRFVHPSVLPASTAGVSCSPASISWDGSQLIGSEFARLRIFGAAPDSIHAMALATGTASLQLFGIAPFQNGCWLLVPSGGPNYLGLLELRIGMSPAWQLPLPEFLSPGTFYFQDFHTIGGGDLTFVSTQRLAVPIGK